MQQASASVPWVLSASEQKGDRQSALGGRLKNSEKLTAES